MVLEHEGEHASRWAAVVSISSKIGCTPQTLHEWVKKAEIDSGNDPACHRMFRTGSRRWRRENRSFARPMRSCATASAYFAQAELDRRYKP